MLCDKVVCVSVCVCEVWSYCMWSYCMWEMLCVWSYCMWSYCMWEMPCDKVVSVYEVIACDVIVCERCYVTKLWVCECVWHYCMLSFCVWSYCMSEMLCDKIVCVSVCEVIVCERCYVTKLCVCECVWSYCMWSVTKLRVWVCVKRGGGRRRRRSPGYRIKNKNPTQSCGELLNMSESKHAKTGKRRTERSFLAASTPTISKLLHRHSFRKPMERTNLTWLTSCCNCACSGGNTMRCNVCFCDLFPRWANITKANMSESKQETLHTKNFTPFDTKTGRRRS